MLQIHAVWIWPRRNRKLQFGIVVALTVSCMGAARGAHAATYYVAPGGTGSGSSGSPFGRIQDGMAAAQPGDVVLVRAGTYAEAIRSVRPGTASAPITLRAEAGRGSVLVTAVGRVLDVSHAWIRVDGLVLDGGYGASDTVKVLSTGSYFVLHDSEVRRSSRDCVDLSSPAGVIIEGSLIHHCLNATNGRTDAHGVVAGGSGRLVDLTIRDTEIHTFSGDAVQVDPTRDPLGWDNLVIERCRLWLAPLPQAENGFAAGAVPGENALDTKLDATAPRARVTIRDTEAWGYRAGLITNMAAFNLKENVDVTIDGVTVWDSEFAFRLRGPSARGSAWVTIQNAVVHDVAAAFRYEDDIENLRIRHATLGTGVAAPFDRASPQTNPIDVQNVLVLAPGLPGEAPAANANVAVSAAAFVDASRHDYRLSGAGTAVDAGRVIAGVTVDRLGVARPQGSAPDVGAFEYCPLCTARPPLPPTNVRITS